MLLNPLRPFVESGLIPRSSFDDLLRDLWTPMLAPRTDWSRFSPRVNVTETTDAYELECELPGVKPEDVKVNLTGDTLTIEGEKRSEARREGDTWHLAECGYGAFLRTFTFPATIDPDEIEATNEYGILKVRVAKSKEAQPRRIEVRAGHKEAIETSAREVPVGAAGKQPQKTA